MDHQKTKERDLAVLEALRHAKNRKSVAEAFGIHQSRISQIIHRFPEVAAEKGVMVRPRKTSSKDELPVFPLGNVRVISSVEEVTTVAQEPADDSSEETAEEEPVGAVESPDEYEEYENEQPYIVPGPPVLIDDMYLAATMVVLGHTINSVSPSTSSADFKVIHFDNDNSIRNHIQRYWNGTLSVEPKAYKLALIDVRNKVRGQVSSYQRGRFYGHTPRSTY